MGRCMMTIPSLEFIFQIRHCLCYVGLASSPSVTFSLPRGTVSLPRGTVSFPRGTFSLGRGISSVIAEGPQTEGLMGSIGCSGTKDSNGVYRVFGN